MKILDEVEDEFLETIEGYIYDKSYMYELLTYIDENYNLIQKQTQHE